MALVKKIIAKAIFELNLMKARLLKLQRITDSKLETLPPIIVCNEDHQFLVSNQFNEAGCSYQSIILEPSERILHQPPP